MALFYFASACVLTLTHLQIYNLVYQEPIFGARYNDKHFFLEQVIKKLGPLPEEWRPTFEAIRTQNAYSDDDGELSPFAIGHIGTDEHTSASSLPPVRRTAEIKQKPTHLGRSS